MPNPTTRDVHVDALLSKVSVAYKNAMYICREIAPRCPVDNLSDYYAKFGKENFNKHDNIMRAPGTAARTVDWTLSTDTYSCKPYALKGYVPKIVEDAADSPINPRQRMTKIVTDQILLDEELKLAAVAFSGSSITQNTTLSGTSQWSDYANSDPVANIETGKAAIYAATGVEPNAMFMGKQVWDKLKNHPDMIERIKYSAKGIVTEDLVCEVFQIPKLIIGKTQYNTAKEGQTVSLSPVWGKHVLLAYIEPNPAQESPTLFYTFTYQDFQTTTWWDNDRKSTAIEVEGIYDQKLVDATCGYLVINAVA